MTWHAHPDALDAYLRGTLDPARSASVEAHTTSCPQCRATVAELSDPVVLETMWDGILDVLDARRDPTTVRGLRRIGVPDATARLVAATSAMARGWMVGGALSLALAVVLAVVDGGATVFLVVAPVVPLLGVAAGYGPALEASREMTVATPCSAFRVLAVRSVAVVVVSIVAGTLLGLALPGSALAAVAWLLPALVLSLAALALLGRLVPIETAAVLTLGWLVTVGALALVRDDELAAFRPGAQLVWAVLAVPALAAALADRERFETVGRGA